MKKKGSLIKPLVGLVFVLLTSQLVGGCAVTCYAYYVVDVENMLDSEVTVEFRSHNIYNGDEPIYHREALAANSTTQLFQQKRKMSGWKQYCHDRYSSRRVEISNDFLSMYTVCFKAADQPYTDAPLKGEPGEVDTLRILASSERCEEGDQQYTDGY